MTLVYNKLRDAGRSVLGYHGNMKVIKVFFETPDAVSKYTWFEPELSVIPDRTVLI